jgi:hypothetical protein
MAKDSVNCEVCSKQLNNKSSLKVHMRYMHSAQCTCNVWYMHSAQCTCNVWYMHSAQCTCNVWYMHSAQCTCNVCSVTIHHGAKKTWRDTLSLFTWESNIGSSVTFLLVIVDASLNVHIKAVHEKIRDKTCPHCEYAASQLFHLAPGLGNINYLLLLPIPIPIPILILILRTIHFFFCF